MVDRKIARTISVLVLLVLLTISAKGNISQVEIKEIKETAVPLSARSYDTPTGEAPQRIEIIQLYEVNKLQVYLLDEFGERQEEKTVNVVNLGSTGNIKAAYMVLASEFAEKCYEKEVLQGSGWKKPLYYFYKENELRTIAQRNNHLWIEYAETCDRNSDTIDAYVWLDNPFDYKIDKRYETNNSYSCQMIRNMYGDYEPDQENVAYSDLHANLEKTMNAPLDLVELRVQNIVYGDDILIYAVDEYGIKKEVRIDGLRNINQEDLEEEWKKCRKYIQNNVFLGTRIYCQKPQTEGEEYTTFWLSSNATNSYEDYVQYCFTAKLIKALQLDPQYFDKVKNSGYIKKMCEDDQ
ncbi:MAG: hypothetical protein U0K68_09460 [Agathobacter sp.]|nr:hypothetical protein [Agathobacter sp.]